MEKVSRFGDCGRATAKDLIRRVPDFPRRNDDFESIYVCAIAPWLRWTFTGIPGGTATGLLHRRRSEMRNDGDDRIP